MTAQEANTVANNKIATTYTYANLIALIDQHANDGEFYITSNTTGYSKEYDQFLPDLVDIGYLVKNDQGFISILWDDISLGSVSVSTTETSTG